MKKQDLETLNLPFVEDIFTNPPRPEHSNKVPEPLSFKDERLKNIKTALSNMASVIPLRRRNEEYDTELNEIVAKLNLMKDEIFDLGLKLALCGRWKNWNNNTPHGVEVTINEDTLRMSGDDKVEKLVTIHDLMKEFCIEAEYKLPF